MKWLVYEEVQNFHQKVYSDTKILDMYDLAYTKTKSNIKISSSVYVTEQEIKSYNESMN